MPRIGPDQIALREKHRVAVNTERDRRVHSGFLFDGALVQSDIESQINIGVIAASAAAAIVDGAAVGDLTWRSGWPVDFAWKMADNTWVPMDAHTMVRLGEALMLHKLIHGQSADVLKENFAANVDLSADDHWPRSGATQANIT